MEWKNNRLGAIDSYTEALKLNPDYVEARVARGKLYYFTGQYAKALEDFNYFYNKPNYGPTVYYEFRINCKKKLGQYAEAVDDMYEVILAYGGNSRLLQDMMDTVNQHSDLEYKLKPVSHPKLLAKYKPNAKKLEIMQKIVLMINQMQKTKSMLISLWRWHLQWIRKLHIIPK
ncbi:MAG: tetratricopeptide repeat protein [Candidatus Gastranaerophilaceae bacterium]